MNLDTYRVKPLKQHPLTSNKLFDFLLSFFQNRGIEKLGLAKQSRARRCDEKSFFFFSNSFKNKIGVGTSIPSDQNLETKTTVFNHSVLCTLREIWVLVAVHGSTNSLITTKNFKIGAQLFRSIKFAL